MHSREREGGRESEKLILPPGYETWENLQAPEPKRRLIVGRLLLQKIIEDELIERVVIFGPPGSGKTILGKQLSELLKINGCKTSVYHFDDALAEAEAQLGYTRERWGKDEWGLLSEKIYRENQLSVTDHQGKRIIELSAMGNPESTNRAITTLYKLVQEGAVLVIGVPADPRTQRKSWHMRMRMVPSYSQQKHKMVWRNAIGEERPFRYADVTSTLEKEFSTRAIWTSIKQPETLAKEGAVIVGKIERTAQFSGINRINTEVNERVAEMLTRENREETDLPHLPLLPKVSPKSLFGNFMFWEDQNFKRNIYHLQDRINQLFLLGLPEDAGAVVINSYSDELVYWYI